jgi:hypothetical protein
MCQKIIQMKKCPQCGKSLPIMTGDGNHNFCPANVDGRVVDVCMECKTAGNTAVGKSQAKW